MNIQNYQFDDLSDQLLAGMESFLVNFVRPTSESHTHILYDSRAKESVSLMVQLLLEKGAPHSLVPIENRSTEFFQKATSSVPKNQNQAISNVVVVECDTVSFRDDLRNLKNSGFAHCVRVTNACPDLFRMCFTNDIETQKKINSGILDFLHRNTAVQVRSDNGTDLEASFDHDKYDLVSNYGDASGDVVLYPHGEVAAYPDSISGVMVADGAINFNFDYQKDVRLHDAPLRIEIENGRIRDITSDDKFLNEFLREITKSAHVDEVGEFGIGSSMGIDKFVHFNSHINERHPGFHLGFGQHHQGKKLGYSVDIHFDVISESPFLVGANGETLTPTKLAPSDIPHPTDTNPIDTA